VLELLLIILDIDVVVVLELAQRHIKNGPEL